MGALDPAASALVRVSAAVASRDRSALETALARAREEAEPGEVDEVLLQSHLFVGFPDALEALALWRRIGAPEPPPPAAETPELWARRGPAVCERVYGSNYPKLRRNVVALHPDFDRWMVEGGYGRVLGRPGLALAVRELCIAALLAVWGAPRQLHSHLRGALNAGAAPEEVAHAMEIAGEFLGPDEAARVHELWGEVAGRSWPPGGSAVASDAERIRNAQR